MLRCLNSFLLGSVLSSNRFPNIKPFFHFLVSMYSLLISCWIHFTYILSRICVSHLLCLLSSYFLSQFESDLLRARAPAGMILLKLKQVGPGISTHKSITAEAAEATRCLHCGPRIPEEPAATHTEGRGWAITILCREQSNLWRDKGKMQRSTCRMTSHASNNDQIMFLYGMHTWLYIRAEKYGKKLPYS